MDESAKSGKKNNKKAKRSSSKKQDEDKPDIGYVEPRDSDWEKEEEE